MNTKVHYYISNNINYMVWKDNYIEITSNHNICEQHFKDSVKPIPTSQFNFYKEKNDVTVNQFLQSATLYFSHVTWI